MKLDIGGGAKKHDWTTIDLNPNADIPHDLNDYPWPIKSNSQSYMRMSHVLEHLDDPFLVVKECFRIAKSDAILEISIPWWKMDMFAQPLHLHHFKPEWFHKLTPTIAIFNPAILPQWGDMDWRVVKEHILRGSRRFWKKYQYTVWLKAIKK